MRELRSDRRGRRGRRDAGARRRGGRRREIDLAGQAIRRASALAAVDSPDDEDGYPVLTPDERSLYFASTRGLPSGAGQRIWVARRPDATSPFGAPVPLEGVVTEPNLARKMRPTWIEPDECALFYVRQNADDVYELRRATRSR